MVLHTRRQVAALLIQFQESGKSLRLYCIYRVFVTTKSEHDAMSFLDGIWSVMT